MKQILTDIEAGIQKSIVQQLFFDECADRNISIFVKRDDLIHSVISGNKWRKLKYNVELCKNQKKTGIITFGGAYSNHLVATAATCKLAGLKAIGFVRGDELNASSNETLKECASLGMELNFISRAEYAKRNDKAYHETIGAEYRSMHLVPEGGANYYGIIGCQEIMTEVEEDVDDVFIAQGTTTTSCGVLLSLKNHQRLHVVPVLKGFDSIMEMRSLLTRSGIEQELIEDLLKQVVVHEDFHFGGYGKHPQSLINDIEQFYSEHKLKLDPIYTGKAMNCMLDCVQKDEFSDKTLLFIHTGGIQGGRGLINYNA